tara:strand:- start:117962 stop:119062 length:1101 start_codon:yes stop_codon:yes gene_type:complete
MKKNKALVNVHALGDTKQFTPKDVETYNQTWDTQRELRPEIFGDECVGGLRWSTTLLIPMDKINPRIDTVDKIQGAVRSGLNPASLAITASIVQGGWDLRELAICVQRDTTDSPYDFIIREGCTRYLSLAGLEFKNVICEVYDHVNPAINPDYFSVYMNYYGQPRGKQQAADLQLFISSEITSQGYDLKSMSHKEIMDVTDGIFTLLNQDVTRKVKNELRYDLMTGAGIRPYETLDKKGCDARLEPLNKEDDNYVYISMGSDPDNLRFLTRYVRNEPESEKHKMLRFVPFKGKLSVEKSEDDYYDLADAGATMVATLRAIVNIASRIDDTTGIFPQLPSLWDKYEKGKLITIAPDTNLKEMVDSRG